MGYYIDIEKIDLDVYKTKLKTAYLPPSRLILREQLEERFGYFKSRGVNTVKDLIQLLKKKETIDSLSKIDYLSGEYLTILLRELKSMLPKPTKLSEFRCISKETIAKLENLGINNTEKLYNRILIQSDRQFLAESAGIDESEISKLARLTDLCRIKWVGATFAQMLYEIGVDTVEKATKSDPVELHRKLNRLNTEKAIYKGQIGLNDIRIFVQASNEVPLEIEFDDEKKVPG
jgi:hypothetical protein